MVVVHFYSPFEADSRFLANISMKLRFQWNKDLSY